MRMELGSRGPPGPNSGQREGGRVRNRDQEALQQPERDSGDPKCHLSLLHGHVPTH